MGLAAMSRVHLLVLSLVLAFTAAGCSDGSDSAGMAESSARNVVILFADDLGYNDLGVQGSRIISTPNIDALAAEGARFTNACATAATCSPSRAALLSGLYQQRFGYEFNTGLPQAPSSGAVRERRPSGR